MYNSDSFRVGHSGMTRLSLFLYEGIQEEFQSKDLNFISYKYLRKHQ